MKLPDLTGKLIFAPALALALALTGLAQTAQAQDLVFDTTGLAACFATADDKRDCIGMAADACMEASEYGYSTVGMGGCLDKEFAWWDTQLNHNYQALMALEKADDAEMAGDGFNAPKKADALRAMQRAWIPFRDATCDYEMSQWGGGTGGGPAVIGCMMRLSAEQTIYLASSRQRD